MLTRSKGLFLSLFALLGVFSLSVHADTLYIKTTIPYPFGEANYYTISSSMDVDCSFLGLSYMSQSGSTVFCKDSTGSRAGSFVLFRSQPETLDGEFPVDESGQCIPDATASFCDPESDSDDDGDPNFLDEDSPAFDPDYCSSDPNSQYYCDPDQSGGGDGSGGGGDTGGGSGGGTWSPPVGSECSTEVDSQSCCTDYGQFYCQDKGGLASADWTDIGGLSCSVTCSDDVIDPPTDGGGGDDGSGGTGGDSGGTGDAFDDSGIVSSIQNASSENSTALNSLQTEITSGFSGVSSDIVDMNNNLATGINGVGSELSTLNATSSDIRSNTAETASAVSELENSLSDIFTINPDTLDGGLDPDSANIDANEYFDGVFATGDLEERTGLDSGASLDTRVIDISELSGDFQPMLGGSSSECPAPYEITVAGTQTSISFDAVCDAFAILSIFVQAAAWFATPFIILGVSKG